MYNLYSLYNYVLQYMLGNYNENDKYSLEYVIATISLVQIDR